MRALVLGVAAGLVAALLPVVPGLGASPASAAVAAFGQPVLGDPVTVGRYGASDGGAPASTSCAPYVVTSLRGYQHDDFDQASRAWLDGLVPTCTAVVSDGTAASLGASAEGPLYGVTSARPAATATTCPAGSVATGVQGRAGFLVDQVELVCAPLQADGTLGDPAPVGTATGGDGGAVADPIACPAGSVVTGLTGRTGASIDNVSLVCRSLAFVRDTAVHFSAGSGDGRVEVPDAFGGTVPGNDLVLSADVRWDGTAGLRGILSQPAADGPTTFEGWSLFVDDGRVCLSLQLDVLTNTRLCPPTVLTVGAWTHVEARFSDTTRTVTVGSVTASADGTGGKTVQFDGESTPPFLVGRLFATAPSSGFGGDIDNVRVARDWGDDYVQTLLSMTFDEGEGVSTTAVVPGNVSEGGTLTGTLTGTPLPTWVDRTPADAGPSNTTWVTASTLTSGTPVAGALLTPGEARWYKIPVNPDGTVTVDLTQLPADYDVTLFKDIGQAFKTLTTPSDLNTLSAEFAGDAFAPSIFSPSIFSPSIFSPSIFSPSIFSPSIFSPSIFSPSIFSPSIFSPSIFSPSIFSPDAYSPSIFSPSIFSPSIFSPSIFSPSIFSPDTFSAAWSSAQTRSIVGYSARDGLADENASAATWDNTGFYYVRVVGRNGAYAPASPYRLTAVFAGGSCDTPLSTFSDRDLGTFAAGPATTVVLTDSRRIPAADRTAFSASLTSLAGATDGVVVDLAASPRASALADQAEGTSQLACPYAKNLLAQAARDLVNGYRAADGSPGALKYVVLAGGDDVVPFFRYPDQSGLGPENGYVPPVKDASAAQASLRRNTFLSQDAYGARVDVSVKGSELPVPDVAVGRLVETPAQIEATIARYVGGSRSISPTTSLTTGYDFLQDAADAVHGTLQAGIGGSANDTLIQKQGDDPAVSWTATQLGDKLFGSKHDVVYLAGHFSANSALAADYTTQLVTTDLAKAVSAPGTADLFTNTLVVSAGCHSGYNLQDQDGVPALTLGLDWAEAFAATGATLVAGTGYQYGDTDFLEYSERLYADFMVQLRTGSTAVPIGSALLAAKQQYLAETPVMRGIHTKALLESTLYGLPMLGMDMPNKVAPPAPVSTVGPVPVAGGPGAVLGLESAELPLTLASSPVQRPMTSTAGGPTVPASYLEGPDGVVTNPAEPTLPLTRTDVTVPGQVLRGIGWRSGTYDDVDGQIPLTGAATTETNAPHAPFTSPAFYPPRLATGNWFDAVADPVNGRTTLAVTGAQYRSDGGTASGVPTSRRRTFSKLGLELFYSNNIRTYGGNTPALAAPPMISGIDATATDGATSVPVSVRVTGDPSAGVQKVWVTYTGTDGTPLYGDWTSVDLIQSPADSTLWTGEIPLPATQSAGAVRFLVQAVNGVGLVSADDNGGEYWTPGRTAPVVAGTIAQQPSQLTLTSTPASGVTGSTVTATATLTSAGASASGIPGRDVRFTLGASTVTGRTGSTGSVTVTIPVLDAPGDVSLQAAFDGDLALGGQSAVKSAVTAVAVTKAPTALTLAPSSVTVKAGVATPSGVTATLTAGGLPLRQKTVWFEVTAADGSVQGVSRITGLDGTVALGDVTLPAGTATVRAVFGGTVTLPKAASAPAVTTSLADPTYAASTASGTLRSGTAPDITGTPPAGRVAEPYTFTFGVTGDPAPTVAVTGTLPPGLSYANGVLSGTPTTEGTFGFTLTATNGVSPDAVTTYSVTVTKAAPRTATVASGNAQVGTAGQPFDKPLVTTVVDASGRPVAGVPVAYRVTSGPASFRTSTGTAATVTVTTDAAGLATSPVLLAGSGTGAVSISAVAGTTATGTASTTFTASVVSVSAARSDLAAALAAPTSAARGVTFTTTVTVRNNGPNTAATVVTGLKAGSPLTVVSAPGATLVSGVWTWTASGLPVGATLTYTVTLKANTTKAGTGSLTVATASLVPDPKLANNAASASVKIP